MINMKLNTKLPRIVNARNDAFYYYVATAEFVRGRRREVARNAKKGTRLLWIVGNKYSCSHLALLAEEKTGCHLVDVLGMRLTLKPIYTSSGAAVRYCIVYTLTQDPDREITRPVNLY
jgi:hypothetical protein